MRPFLFEMSLYTPTSTIEWISDEVLVSAATFEYEPLIRVVDYKVKAFHFVHPNCLVRGVSPVGWGLTVSSLERKIEHQ